MKKIYALFKVSCFCFDLANVNKKLIAIYDDLELAISTQKTLEQKQSQYDQSDIIQATRIYSYVIEEFELNPIREPN
jgi:hypothetical protein